LSHQGTSLAVKVISTANDNSNITRNANAETLTIDCDRDFTLRSVHMSVTADAGGDDLNLTSITIDGTTFTTEVGAAAIDIDTANQAWEGEILSLLANVNQDDESNPVSVVGLSAVGAGTNDIVFNFAGTAAGADDTIIFQIGIITDLGATCTAVGS